MRFLLFTFIMFIASPLMAAQDYVSGNISNLTSTTYGLMIMIGSNQVVPDNCVGTPYNWMLIPDENKTMISVALTAWTMGRGVAVYTNQRTSGYCVINQVAMNNN